MMTCLPLSAGTGTALPQPVRMGLCRLCLERPLVWLELPLLPRVPTTFAPGTAAKLVVLALRAERGLDLFHPADARETFDQGLRVESGPHLRRVLGLVRERGQPLP